MVNMRGPLGFEKPKISQTYDSADMKFFSDCDGLSDNQNPPKLDWLEKAV